MELSRKQAEMSSVHDLLAQWVVKYMDLEKSKGVSGGPVSLRALFEEYVIGLY
jgi:hypothetical protein